MAATGLSLPLFTLLFAVETPRSDKAGPPVWLPSSASPRVAARAEEPLWVLLDSLFKQHGRNLRSLSKSVG